MAIRYQTHISIRIILLTMISGFLAGCFGGCNFTTASYPEVTQTPDLPDVTVTQSAPAESTVEVKPIPTKTLPPPETSAPEETPDLTGPYVPVRDEPVADEYFSDVAFIGNSLMEGFRLYSGLKDSDVFADTSMTVVGAADAYIYGLSQKEYSKIYILLGINEIGFDPDYFKSLYSDMTDKFLEVQPDADIFIMGLTPVSQSKSLSSDIFNMDRIELYNERLFELAEERGFYYIDLCEALSDENGYLPSGATSDGVHFSADLYKVWLEYLKIHYI